MSDPSLPLLIEPEELEPLLGRDDVRIVDVGKANTYRQLHVPGAVHLEYHRIVTARKPVDGLLPEPALLEGVFSELGIETGTPVIAYDDEGGGNAARLLWTLESMGHTACSLLNGGLHAWANERFPLDNRPGMSPSSHFAAAPNPGPVADADFILKRLGDDGNALIDARSSDEYTGARRYARRGGHIPGAVNFEWTTAMDRERNLRMLPAEALINRLGELGVTPDKQVVTYCQTHHRSSYSYWMLRVLGYPSVRGYPGSWSDWGNRPDTPVE